MREDLARAPDHNALKELAPLEHRSKKDPAVDANVDPNVGAHYSFNVGAAFCPSPGTPSPMVYMYGHDPTVVVKGGHGPKS